MFSDVEDFVFVRFFVSVEGVWVVVEVVVMCFGFLLVRKGSIEEFILFLMS